MAPRSISINEFNNLVGQDIGVSDWFDVTQERVNAFADATLDHQWIHIDPDRAKRESPFGGPIAHGYFTLSLFPHLLDQALTVEGVKMGLNYGLNKLRFPAPVPVGSRIRAHAKLQGVEQIPGGMQAIMAVTVEVEGSEKPACAAECVFRYYT